MEKHFKKRFINKLISALGGLVKPDIKMKHLKLYSLILAMSVLTGCGACRQYQREQNRTDAEYQGQAELLKAESEKKVLIETAKANLESAKLNAEAEIIRAKGVAEANKIIGNSLKDNKAYLDWLWIDNIEKNPNAVYYIPTENKTPIFYTGK